jgi:hypothetical protein
MNEDITNYCRECVRLEQALTEMRELALMYKDERECPCNECETSRAQDIVLKNPAAFVAAFEAMKGALRHARPLVGEFDYTSETLAVVDAALKLADAAKNPTP